MKLFQTAVLLLLSLLCAPAWANGTITHFSGEISVQRKDGTTVPGAAGTVVNEGDVMITGPNGYGRLEMTDGGEMVLRPNSQLKIDSYRFHADKPADDSFAFRMLKGGLRTVTGLIGKRGNKDAYVGTTATATIGIRGTQFDLRLCQGDCGALADGTYLAVRFGAVRTGNAQGSLDVAAGQVALVPAAKIPVMLPRDPGIGFTPPAVIPKLDEKKKQQSAAPAAAAPAQAKPAAAASTQARPAAARSGQAASGSSTSTASSSSGGTQESSSGDSGGKSGSSSAASGSTSGGGTTNTSSNSSSSGAASSSSNVSGAASSGAGSGSSVNAAAQGGGAAPVQQAAAQPTGSAAAVAETAPAAAPAQQAPAQVVASVAPSPVAETEPAAAPPPGPAASVALPAVSTALPQTAPGMDCSVQ